MLITDAQVHLWEAHRPDRPWPPEQVGTPSFVAVPGARPHRAEPLGADELVATMDASGIDRAVIVPPSPVGDSNDTALEAALRFPDRFAVTGRFNPDLPDAPERLESWLAQPGMLGIRMTFYKPAWARWLVPGTIDWFWAGCERLGIPVSALAPGLLPDIARLAERYPGLTIILDHMARRSDLRDAACFADPRRAAGPGPPSQRRRQGDGAALLHDRALPFRQSRAIPAAQLRRVRAGAADVGIRPDPAALQLHGMPGSRPPHAGLPVRRRPVADPGRHRRPAAPLAGAAPVTGRDCNEAKGTSMHRRLHRRAALSVFAGAALAPVLPMAGRAAEYPDHAIRVVVPFSAGGAVDIVARTVMQKVGPALGQSIVVDNRPGASGNIGPALVAQAPADGYTILAGANGLATNGALFDDLPFDAAKDLQPVALVGYSPLILVVKPSFAARTAKELVAMAKASPGKLTYASAGNGTSGHLAAEIFKQVAGIDAVHVPYRGGAQALVDIMGGRISFMFLDPVQTMPQIRAGQLRALAVSAPQRLALLPEVPTLAEAGYPGADATVWWGFLVPAGTPNGIVVKLNQEIDAALADQKVKGTLLDMGVVLQPGSPADFAAFLRSETARWAAIIKQAGIKAD